MSSSHYKNIYKGKRSKKNKTLLSPQHAYTHVHAGQMALKNTVIHEGHCSPPVSLCVTPCQLDKQDSHHTAEGTPSSSHSFHLFNSACLTGKLSYEAFQSTSNKQVHCANGILYTTWRLFRENVILIWPQCSDAWAYCHCFHTTWAAAQTPMPSMWPADRLKPSHA